MALLAFTTHATAQDRFQLLHEFTGDANPSPDGARPAGPLVEASDGYLYGTTTVGGSLNRGTLFRMSRTGGVSVVHEFVGGTDDGAYPGALVQATDGNLYGLTQGGGPQNRGTIFRLSPAGPFAIVYSFAGGADGSNPLQLIQATDGFLYGIAQLDGPFGRGTMFRLDPPGTPTVIHAFGSSPSDGIFPTALMQASDGSFYGATLTNNSTAFRMLPDGTYIPLHTFDPTSEGILVRTLAEGNDGNFYGATSCRGTIFRMTPGGQVTVLSRQDDLYCDRVHAPFDNVSISLVPVPDGSFYGVRHRLRDSDDLFTMTSEGALTVLHTFTFAGDSGPMTLMSTRSGNLYGTTFLGGPGELGTIFRFNLRPESIMFIDRPTPEQTVLEPFAISGWAIDATSVADAGVDAMQVWAYPNPGSGAAPVFAGVASIGRARSDVGAFFGDQFAASGFELTVRDLPPGPYQFVVFAHHPTTGTFDDARTVSVTIGSSAAMSIDSPLGDATVFGSVRIAGWAIDRAASTGTAVGAVHVWAYPNPGSGQAPIFLGAAAYGGARPDVGAVFGSQFTNSAYDLTVGGLAPGTYQVRVFAYSTVSHTFSAAMDVSIRSVLGTAMAVDVPAAGATIHGPFTMSGWAIDRAATSNTGVDAVHVWAFPVSGATVPQFLGVAVYGGPRPDVAAIFGPPFANSAYTLSAPALAPGVYDLVVFARSRVAGAFNDARVVRVTVLP